MRLASSSACRRGAAAAVSSLSRRGYAAAAAASNGSEFSVSSSSSGIKVATLDEGLPTSAVTVAVKAGSRYESLPGLAHVLKNFVFKVRQRAAGNGQDRGLRRILAQICRTQTNAQHSV